MKWQNIIPLAALGVGLPISFVAVSAQLPPDHPGRAIYSNTCAMCHDNPGTSRAPGIAVLRATPPDRLREVLTVGVMKSMASSLKSQELNDLIEYLTEGQQPSAANWSDAIVCAPDRRTVDLTQPVIASGFGVDANQTRSLSAQQAGLRRADLSNLEVAWAVGFPGLGAGTGASIIGDTIFIAGGQKLLAMDAKTGCVKWSHSANTRNTPAIGKIGGRTVLAIAIGSDIHVIDAATGALVWKASGQPVNGTGGAIRGGVIFAKGKIIVPLSASGVGAGANEKFECCTGHGSVVALNAADGKHLWEYHTMPEPVYTGQVSSIGVKQRGPSGAPIWSVPLYDAKRNRVLVTTGENTSHPGTETSDAIIALDIDTGKVAWLFQAMKADIWNTACSFRTGVYSPNCPLLFGGDGRDFDFGAGAVMTNVGGKDVILAGQKSGNGWALDAQTGKVLWGQRVGQGTALGGVHWGVTTDGTNLFLPIADPLITIDPKFVPKPGVYAFNLKTGKPAWSYDAKRDCRGERGKLVINCETKYGFSAAPLVIDGTFVGGTLDGKVIILDGKSGKVLNEIDTIRTFKTINAAIAGKGGTIDAHGLSAGAGMLFVNSGYSSFNQTPGNVLIALRPKRAASQR